MVLINFAPNREGDKVMVMLRIAIALATLVLGGRVAMAGQVPIPLLLPDDVRAAVAPRVFQGVSGAAAGAVYFPDQALAVRIEQGEGDAARVIDQWSKSHTFYLISFSISIAASDDYIPEQVDVTAAFGGLGKLTRQPIIIDSFPRTGFKPASFSGSGEVRIASGVQFELVTGGPAKAGVEANAAFKFNYAPAYADIISGFASAHAFWQFSRTQEQYPVGAIPMKLLVVIPQTFKSDSLTLNFDVKVRFSGSWWTRGRAIASFKTIVRLPDGG